MVVVNTVVSLAKDTLEVKATSNSSNGDPIEGAFADTGVPGCSAGLVGNYPSERPFWYKTDKGLNQYFITARVSHGSTLGL